MGPKNLVVISVCAFMLASCSPSPTVEGEFVLLPQPVTMEVEGSSSIFAGDLETYFSSDSSPLPPPKLFPVELDLVQKKARANLWISIDKELGVRPEGYHLEISDNRISLVGKDQAGLLYGFMTLRQLMEDASDQGVPLPVCRIRDYPLLSYRAIHLDMKHHLEKREYYYQLLDYLAGYKINAVIAEMEDKLAYERQPEVGSSDALTMDEWKELSHYAMERNIEISPLIQGLGHASFILKHEQYRDLRDDPSSDWAFNPLDPETYEVQFDLYRDALEATPFGRYLHVGGDEVHTTGRGSGRSPLELQLAWLEKVTGFAEEHHRTPIFWDDMPLKHAGLYESIYDPNLTQTEVDSIWERNEHSLLEFLDQFPKNCIYMRWNYSVPQALSNLKAMNWFRSHELQVMGATAGQTRWVLMPQNESNMENIKSFSLSSIHQGLEGLLLTLWDDDSPHFELYTRGILAFAEYTWSGERRSKEEIKSAYRHREFSWKLAGNEFAFIDQLEEPVAFWNNALLQDQKDRRSLRKMTRPLQHGVIELPDENQPGQWSGIYAERVAKAARFKARCDTLETRINAMKSQATRNRYRLKVYEQVNRLASFAPEVLMALEKYDRASDPSHREEALNQLKQLDDSFRSLREGFEEVYCQTRIIDKPDDYILDQDHHNHLANQTLSFDWQFTAELLFLEKLRNTYFSSISSTGPASEPRSSL